MKPGWIALTFGGFLFLTACETTPVGGLIARLDDPEPAPRAHAEAELIKAGVPALDPLIEILRTGSAHQRRHAAIILRTLAPIAPDPMALAKPFVQALGDDNPDVVIHALLGLGDLRAAETLDAILGVAVDHPDLAVKQVAVQTAARTGSPEATERLTALARDETNRHYLRVVAIVALGENAEPSAALSTVWHLLQTTGDQTVRSACEQAAVRLIHREPRLAQRFAADAGSGDPSLSDSMASIIAQVGPPFFSVATYRHWLQNARPANRARLIRSLVQTDQMVLASGRYHLYRVDSVTLAALQELLLKTVQVESETMPLAAAAWAAGQLEVMASAERLVALLDHDDAGVRHNAVAALRTLSHQRFGYESQAPKESRVAARSRWQGWVALQQP